MLPLFTFFFFPFSAFVNTFFTVLLSFQILCHAKLGCAAAAHRRYRKPKFCEDSEVCYLPALAFTSSSLTQSLAHIFSRFSSPEFLRKPQPLVFDNHIDICGRKICLFRAFSLTSNSHVLFFLYHIRIESLYL